MFVSAGGSGFEFVIPPTGARSWARTLSGRPLPTQVSVAAIAAPVTNFFAGNLDNRGGVRVAAKDLDGDWFADLVSGDGEGGGSRVTGYLGSGFTVPFAFDAFPGDLRGVYVG